MRNERKRIVRIREIEQFMEEQLEEYIRIHKEHGKEIRYIG